MVVAAVGGRNARIPPALEAQNVAGAEAHLLPEENVAVEGARRNRRLERQMSIRGSWCTSEYLPQFGWSCNITNGYAFGMESWVSGENHVCLKIYGRSCLWSSSNLKESRNFFFALHKLNVSHFFCALLRCRVSCA